MKQLLARKYFPEIADGLNPEGMPSMRQDGMAKRYSEVELFSGTVIPLAQKHGIDVPNCREFASE